jgi:hypothetical protein
LPKSRNNSRKQCRIHFLRLKKLARRLLPESSQGRNESKKRLSKKSNYWKRNFSKSNPKLSPKF